MKTKTIVWVTTQFEAFHRWEDAPEDVSFLRNYHRHIFEVMMGVQVNHSNRDIEFFQLKKTLEDFIEGYSGTKFEASCEMIAENIFETFNNEFDVEYVEVSEDGENGARVERD